MKKYQSDVSRSVHEMMEGLYKLGGIDAKEMHEFDVNCLVPSRVPIREASSYSGSGDSYSSAPIPAVAAAHT